MSRPRIIPSIKINERNEAITTTNFNKINYIGDAFNVLNLFNEFDVDEIILVDIFASKQNRLIDRSFIENLSQELNLPLSIGGGIKSLNDIETLIKSGAEKVILCSNIYNDEIFYKNAIKEFGSSSIITSIDIYKCQNEQYNLYNHVSKKILKKDLYEYLKKLEQYGMGECLIQNVNFDGTMDGFDNTIYNEICDILSVPLIVQGSCGSFNDIINLLNINKNISAFAIGSMFAYYDKDKQVLINYPEPQEIEKLII